MSDQRFCSDVSRGAGESLTATSSRVDVWLCLEYTGLWGHNALKESDLPEAVKAHLQAAESSIPNARVELIKQENRQPNGDIQFYVAVSRESDPKLYRFTLAAYEDLLRLDLAKIAAHDAAYADTVFDAPMLLTCVNGKRDACCAKYGLPVYHALRQQASGNVWQCTHLGGHRFAANVALLPTGVYYGRATPADAATLADPSLISLAHYRGRSCYDEPAQAADAFLRGQLKQTALRAFRLAGVEQTADTEWLVHFGGDGRAYQVGVAQKPAGFGTFTGCGETEPTDVMAFQLVGIEEMAG